jgi:hypothetical protein
MKKNTIIFLSGMAFVALFSFRSTEEKDKSLGRVQKVQGKYIFLNSEPVNDYDVSFLFNTSWTFVSSKDINDQISGIVGKAFKESSKKNLEFDAVIIGNDDKQTAIKFK